MKREDFKEIEKYKELVVKLLSGRCEDMDCVECPFDSRNLTNDNHDDYINVDIGTEEKDNKLINSVNEFLKLCNSEDEIINFQNCSLKELIICSFRYCLGRQTILSNTFVDFLKDNWEMFEDYERNQIKKEIEDHKRIYGSIGDKSIDEPKWLDVLNWKG